MNIYNRSTLIAFYKKHPDCKENLEKWFHDVETSEWKKPSDVVRDFNSARTIKNNRAIFDINRNDYRLVIEITYPKAWVFIKFIGTHSQYDKIDLETIVTHKSKKKE